MFRHLDHRELNDEERYPRFKEYLYDYVLPQWFGRDETPARISPLMWSHGRIEDEEMVDHPLTTNSLESLHSKLNSMGHRDGHRFWTIMDLIKRELGKTIVVNRV